MIPWNERPAELAHLLNPAFIAAVLARACSGYQDQAQRATPFPLLFIAVPIVLHRATREKLPRNPRTRMAAWLQRTPEARVGFAERAHDLAPFVREGVSFGLAAQALRITPDGGLEIGSGISSQRTLPRSGDGAAEVNECLQRATFVGKWLAGEPSPTTVFTIWGIRP